MTGSNSITGFILSFGATLLLLLVAAYSINGSDESAPLHRQRRMAIDPKTVEGKDPWKSQLLIRLNDIREVCGDLCSVTDEFSFMAKLIPVPGADFGRIEADVDCNAVINDADIDAGDNSVPYPPPQELMPFYTLNGKIDFHQSGHLKNVYLGGEAHQNVWSKQDIEDQIKQVSEGTLKGTYSADLTNTVRDELTRADLTGKSVLVIGSENPWVEVICLYLGAAKVTTLEYGAIRSEHPQLHTLTPAAFRLAYQDGSLGWFDTVVSFSSMEHSGLGRYGDALNPWGDILGIARAWCVTKPGGQLFLGVPSSQTFEDSVEFNAHRIYGKVRWPLIATNWKQADVGFERSFVHAGVGLSYLFNKANEAGSIKSVTPRISNVL
jgi:Caenorhabditis protein of unknown function, DUF268